MDHPAVRAIYRREMQGDSFHSKPSSGFDVGLPTTGRQPALVAKPCAVLRRGPRRTAASESTPPPPPTCHPNLWHVLQGFERHRAGQGDFSKQR